MYADDIILDAPLVCVLQKLLDKYEQQLNWLGMAIDVKKSCCMRVGPCCDQFALTSNRRQLPCVKEIRWLGIYVFSLAVWYCGYPVANNLCVIFPVRTRVITSDKGGGKCVFPRLSVCLSVSKITQKWVHGLGLSAACRQMSGHGRTD